MRAVEGCGVCAAVGAAAVIADGFAQEGGMFTCGDPDVWSARLGVEGFGSCDLARVTEGVFVCGGIPIPGLPCSGAVLDDQSGDVLGVKCVACLAAVLAPEIVIMQLDGIGVCGGWKGLRVDGAVVSDGAWLYGISCEFCRPRRAVGAADEEMRLELS